MSNVLSYRPDVDGLRAVAVVPVVLYHANVAGFSGGYVGVDIFFVISGYLITTIILRELGEGRFSILSFYERRARRILPALFAVMIACLAAGWFILAPDDYDHMGQSILSALLFVSNIWFWQNSGGYFDGATDYLPMLHTWSLAVEEQFYIFAPLLLMALHRFARRLLLPVLMLAVVGSLVAAVWATPRMPSAAFYLLPTRVWELGFGALLAMGLLPARLPRALREGLALLGLAGVLVPVFLYQPQTMFPGAAAVPPVLGATLLIWTGGTGPTLAARLLALRPMVGIGLISYSLYLWHWPIMAFVRNRLLVIELEPAWQFATVLAALVAGWLSWRLIERPFRIPIRHGGIDRIRIFAFSGSGIFALGMVCVAIARTDGAASARFTPEQTAALDAISAEIDGTSACFGARSTDTLCIYGAMDTDGTPDWLLWGDSHGRSALPAIAELAHQSGKSLIFAAQSACAPLPDLWRSDRTVSENKRCNQFRMDVRQFVSESDSIEKVFIAGRWPLYVEGVLTDWEGGDRIDLTVPNAQTPASPAPAGNSALVEETLVALVTDLSRTGRAIYLMETAPEVNWDVAVKMKRRVLFDTDLPVPPQLSEVKARQAGSNRVLRAVSAKTGAQYIKVIDRFCTPECRVYDNLTAFYRDDNHLNAVGSLALLGPVLREALGVQSFDLPAE